MTTDTVTQQSEILKARRAKVRARLKKRGVLQEHIAAAAKCDRTLVVHYFAGRRSPESVERVIRDFLAAKPATRPRSNGAVAVAS